VTYLPSYRKIKRRTFLGQTGCISAAIAFPWILPASARSAGPARRANGSRWV